MPKIGLFVKEAKKWLKLKEPVIFIVGNESCDLDSAVCAVGLAYFYANTNKLPASLTTDNNRRFLPLMNIDRTNLSLKTEVTYYMKKHAIDLDDLVCGNEVSSELLNVSKFILVDHHIATSIVPAATQIVQIFDHRPINQKEFNCITKIQEVGSCATLIADAIRQIEGGFSEREDVIDFLRAPIILDTINFSKSADKVKPLDIEINDEIEAILGKNESSRLNLFNELVKARSDVSSLSALQLLSKDMKMISSKNKSKIVAIPGFPILVEEYMQKENAFDSLLEFAEVRNCDVLVLMGMKQIANDEIRRDLATLQLRDGEFSIDLVQEITTNNKMYLDLQQKDSVYTVELLKEKAFTLFEQRNVKASRKQILPIVQKVLDRY